LPADNPAFSVRAVKGILGDGVRLYWAAVYWNIRKTLFRLRRTRGLCPCQHHSDSGLANETACAAVTHWREPARFRRVCPLLRQRPDGLWRCSVDAAAVRPFWGRVAVLYGGTLVMLALVASLGTFGLMRAVGYDVSLRQLVWPPAWSELARVRSAYFIDRADRTAAEGNIKESLLSLYNAYELDPANYAAGLRLARLWQPNQARLSDGIYQRLLRDHPDRRAETARLWLPALLARGDFDSVQHLAAERLLNENPPSPAWLHALIFAARRTGDSEQLDTVRAAPGLPAPVAATLALVADTRDQPAAAQRARLIRTILEKNPDAYATLFIGRELLRLGHADEALALTLRPDAALAPRERILLRLDALAALGRAADRAELFEQVLRPPPATATVELLCAHLIRHPAPDLVGRLFERTGGEGDAATLRYETRMALFCVAGVHADADRLRTAAADLRALGGGEFRTLDAVQNFFLRRTGGGQVQTVLPILQPLPLEITYALLERNNPPAP